MASQAIDSGVANSTPVASDGEKLLKTPPPLLTRLGYSIAVFVIQKLVIRPTLAYMRFKSSRNPSDETPSRKTYECRPYLPVHIFFPKGYDQKSPKPLPLLLTIHGGGFTVGDPMDNDWWNSTFANEHNALVIGLNYAKAPANPFPGQLSDLEALFNAVFADAELKPHINLSKVGLGGWSAGGNLTLGLSQFPHIREKITSGIVPLYPACDLSITSEAKAKTRQYKPSLGGFRGGLKDFLLMMGAMFDWAYIPGGTNLRDPLLSPVYARKEDLPKRVWIIGCELDMLAHEGWRTISKLAERPVPSMETRVGKEEAVNDGKGESSLVLRGDQRFAWEEKNRDGEYKWLLVPDAVHGFDQALAGIGADEVTLTDGKKKTLESITLIGEWLWR